VSYVQPGNWKTTKRRILERDGHTCYMCGGPAVTADHVVNVAAGGTHDDDNLAAICAVCHEVKSKAERAVGQRRRAQRGQRPAETHPGLLS